MYPISNVGIEGEMTWNVPMKECGNTTAKHGMVDINKQ